MSTRALGKETKYQKVYSDLERLANRLAPEEKLPSMRELVVSLDAGINTLTGALQELEAKNVIYRRHGVGVFVSPRRAKNIWVICSPSYFSQGRSPFWDVLLSQAQRRATEKQENLSLHFALPGGDLGLTLHQSLLEEIQQGRVHGILGIGLDHAAAHWIAEQSIPYTSFAGWAPYRVRLNEKSVIRLGVQALAERGCRRIGLWLAGELEGHLLRRSFEAFHEAMAACGLKAEPELTSSPVEHDAPGFDAQHGYRLATEMFSGKNPPPDGVVSTYDVITQSALLAMAQLGVRAGRDVQLVTHANRGVEILPSAAGEMIRIEYDPEEIAAEIFQMLETLMAGETPVDVEDFVEGGMVKLIEPRLVGNAV